MSRRAHLKLELDAIFSVRTEAEVSELRAKLLHQPTALDSRILLHAHLARTQAPRSELLEHVTYFVENAPYLLGSDASGLTQPGTKARASLAQSWLIGLERFSTDPEALQHGFEFFLEQDPVFAAALISRVLVLAPRSWSAHEQAGRLNLAGADIQLGGCSFALASEHFHTAHSLARFPYNRFEGSTALAALLAREIDRARVLAGAAIEPSTFNLDHNSHLGHTVLGLLAVEDGLLPNGEEHLLTSVVKLPGKASPSLRLAWQLMDHGRSEVVAAFFARIAAERTNEADRYQLAAEHAAHARTKELERLLTFGWPMSPFATGVRKGPSISR